MVLTPSRGAAVVRSNFEPVVSTVLFHSRGTRGCPIFTFSLSLLFTLMMYDAQVVARSSSMSVNVDRGRTDRGSKQLPLNTAICHFTHHVREKLYALPVLCNLSTHLKYADVFCV